MFITLSRFFSALFPFKAKSSSVPIKARGSLSDSYKKLKYEASLTWNYKTSRCWWNKIEPHTLYLGGLPLKNKGHLESIMNLKINHVLSVVENFEIEDGWLHTPITKENWQDHGIEFTQIPAVDSLALSPRQLEEGIECLQRALEKGQILYVHDKSGRGRSSSIVIGFLMKTQSLSFTQAYTLVKKQHPQMHLNRAERQAVQSYFPERKNGQAEKGPVAKDIYSLLHNTNEFTQESLIKFLDNLLYYVIEGVEYKSTGPQLFSRVMPAIDIHSTIERRNRYLRAFKGDPDAATQAVIDENHNFLRRLKIFLASCIPFLGMPTSHSMTLWIELREITLIASLHGHDIHDEEVRLKILSCLVGGDILKLPAFSIQYVADAVAKKFISNVFLSTFKLFISPVRMIYDYLTNNTAHVGTHAKALFGGKNSKRVDPVSLSNIMKTEKAFALSKNSSL